jgi:hypothetical protein
MARRSTTFLLAIGAACLLTAAVGAYAGHAILDQQGFADRAARALRSDEVRSEVSARLADRTIAEHGELAPDRATLEDAAASAVIEDRTFTSAFRTAAARMHQRLFSSADAPAELTVPRSGAAMRAELSERLPPLARGVPRIDDQPLLAVSASGPEGALRRLAPPARRLGSGAMAALALVGLALIAVAVAVERDRRRGLWGAGIAVAAAAGLVATGVTAANDVLLEQFDTTYGDAVVSAVWDAFLADLRWWSLGVAGGALVVAAAMRQPRPSGLPAPTTPLGRAARAAGLLALAGLALELPLLVLHVALAAAAAALVYVAAGDLLGGRALGGSRS